MIEVREVRSEHRQLLLTSILPYLGAVYALVWVLEGAVRKWVPGASVPLYFGRDIGMLGAMVLVALFYREVNRLRWFLIVSMAFAAFACLQVVVANLSLPVALVGLRNYLAPLALLAAVRLEVSQLTRVARVLAWCAPFELLLSVGQVLSPPESFINRQTTEGVSNFVLSGIIRPSGSFSAPSGLTAFLLIALGVSAGLALSRDKLSIRLGLVALVSVILNVSISISRGAALGLFVSVLAAVVLAFLYQRWAKRIVVFLLVGSVGASLAIYTIFPKVINSFVYRFETASRSEDTGGRIAYQSVGFWIPTAPFGSGIGSNSQAGLSVGASGPWIEAEGARWTSELGYVGFGLNLLRILFVAFLVYRALSSARAGQGTQYFVLVGLALTIFYGAVTQTPSTQGYTALALALGLGSAKERKNASDNTIERIPDTSVHLRLKTRDA